MIDPAVRRAATPVMLALLASVTSGCALLAQVAMQGGGEAGPLMMAAGASEPTPVASSDGVCAEFLVLAPAGEAVDTEAVEETRQVIADRLAATGVTAPALRAERSDRIVLVLPEVVPGSEADTALRDLVLAPGVVRFLAVPAELQGQLIAEGPVPAAMAGLAPILDGRDVAEASVAADEITGATVVHLVLSEEGGRLVDAFAAANLGEQLAIVADGAVVTAPTINAARFDGQIQIVGDFTADEAASLVAILGSGPLPLEVREIGWTGCAERLSTAPD